MRERALIHVHCRSTQDKFLPQLNLKLNFLLARKNYGPKLRIEIRSNMDIKVGALCIVHLSALILFLIPLFSFFPFTTLH